MISPNDPSVRAALGLEKLNYQGDPAWAPQYKPAVAGNPWGYQYDPRYIPNIGKDVNDAYTNWTREQQGMQPLNTQPVTGLAGQTYAAGGDLAAMAEKTRQPGYGMGPYSQPMTEDARQAQLANPNLPPAARPLVTAAPTSAPGVPSSAFGQPRTGTPAPSAPTAPTGGGTQPPYNPGGIFTPGGTGAPTGGTKPPAGGISGPFGGAAMAAPKTSPTMLPGGTQAPQGYNPITPTSSGAQYMSGSPGIQQTPGTMAYSSAQPAASGAQYMRGLPGGGEGDPGGTIDPGTGTPAPTGGAPAPGGSGSINALTGMLGNMTGRLEAYQKANYLPNALGWMQDLGNAYNDPRAAGPDAATSLQTGANQFSNDPAFWATSHVLQNGIPGQDVIPGISNQLMTQENANPLSTQSRNIYGQLLSGEIAPANKGGIDSYVGQMLGMAPGMLNQAQSAAGTTPNALNQAASYINPGAAQGMMNPNLVNQAAGYVNPSAASNTLNPSLVNKGASMASGGENPLVSNFNNDILQNGLGGDFANAFKSKYYDPARDDMLADLQRRGVLDSSTRMGDEAQLLNDKYLEPLRLQELAAKQQAAQSTQAGRGLDISGANALSGLSSANTGMARAQSDIQNNAAGALGNLANVGTNMAGTSSNIGNQSASTLGNLANTNLNYADLMSRMGSNAGSQAMQGFNTTEPLMAQILAQATGAGSTAEQNALNRVQTGMQGYGNLNQDLLGYLGMGTNQALGAGRLGLDAENSAASRFQQNVAGASNNLSNLGNLAMGAEGQQMSGIIDLINAAVGYQTGQQQSNDTRSAANKGAIGGGIGSILSILPFLL